MPALAITALTSQGPAVKDLQANLTKVGLIVPAAEASQSVFGAGTRDAVLQFQSQYKLPATGVIDDVTKATLAGVAAAAADQSTVSGRIAMDYGLPANGVTVRLYSLGFGGVSTKLAETKTDANGVYTFAYTAPAGVVSLEIRALDPSGKEATISQAKLNAQSHEVLNLVAPASVQPLTAEFQRFSADMDKAVGGIAKLGAAQESSTRRDLTLVSQSTNWDARLVALAATAAQQTTATGMGVDVLYALYRVGLPTDPQQLALVPADGVAKALAKANQAGIVTLNTQQLTAAATAFQAFATRTQLTMIAPGAISSFGDLLKNTVADAGQQASFASLYFSQPLAGSDLWQKAAAQHIPAPTVAALQLQGKLLYLTFNNAALAQKLQQQVGSIEKLSQLADAGFHDGAAWKTALTAIAGTGGDAAMDKLVPPAYAGSNVADRLEAYAGDLARRVRYSFPTQVTARMIDQQQLAVEPAHAATVSSFLKAAAPAGYELGRTPLNAFLANPPAGVAKPDAATVEALKGLHRAFQLTPSTESMQAALKLGLTSARQITSYTRDEFLDKFAAQFPPGEAHLVYRKAQQISSVTFNFFSMAKQLDSAPPVYGLSGTTDDRQNAKNAIVKQFPTMASLFGNLDFCQCEDCRSVLSPAAYFVDLLELLGKSAANKAGYTPLDVLIGKDSTVQGRRPDLAALPLTCENTNTPMPYIDLVNEILEYYVAHNKLDASAAYDTADVTTEDLAAEPQHILPAVYSNTLNKAVYPIGLPFDLWIETVRGFFNYFKTPLAKVMDAMRSAGNLELFTDAHAYPYYRAQIFAESLGLSPAEYCLLSVTNLGTHLPDVQNWFQLYGYADQNTALNGKVDPTDATQFIASPLKSAKNLAVLLGVSYQDVVDLTTTGFLNPALDALVFQFERFGISIQDAFAYTGQPGYTPLSGQAKTDFETLLDAITQRYQATNATFNARSWLAAVLPANYSKKVLVLDDPDTGCNFSETTLQYADGSAATPLDFLKLNLLVRLWKKLGCSIDEIDRALQLFFPSGTLPDWSDAGFAAAFSNAWKTALVNLAHLGDLATRLAPAMGSVALLPLWSALPVRGTNPLFAQLFLTPSVLNNDPAFDDPAGQFPSATSDFLSAHQAALQGALGLLSDDVSAILADAGSALSTVTKVVNGQNVTAPSFSLANLSICYRYATLAKCIDIPVADLIALKALSGLNPFQAPAAGAFSVLSDDVLFTQTLAFIKQVAVVQASGFTVADLQYLLRHKFDPVGPYQQDPNAQIALAQLLTAGLRQIQSQNALPTDVTTLTEDILQQRLSALFPAQVLKSLFALLTDSQSYTASQGGVAPASQIDPAPLAQETQLALSYDATTQTQSLTYQGVLLDWKKALLLQLNNSALFAGLLDALQKQVTASLEACIGNLLGVWSSLAQYEAVRTGVATPIDPVALAKKDPGVQLSYDQAAQLQWLAYRGVLTDARKADLAAINPSATLLALLNDVQQQALPTYRELVGCLLAMWSNVQPYQASVTAVAPANQIDPTVFAGHPDLRLSYDAVAQTQTLVYQGVLTDANRLALAAQLPTSTVLPNLLQAVRNQALQFFQGQAAGLLTIAAADLDSFSRPFLGSDVARQQKRVKEQLVKTFVPLLARKLSRQLVVQTVASKLGADARLIEDLITDAALLSDPNTPGKSLLASFLALGRQGFSATYYASVDGSGPALTSGTASSADTADATNPNAGKAGTGSAHFEGYLQVPTDGPYRFYAELGNQNARATLRLDSPDPGALIKNPILDATAAKDLDEASQYVVLNGGTPYHFSVDLTALGANGASVLIQGENLAKGALGQVVLYPAVAVQGFVRASTVVSKVLQILQTFGLDERELSYLVANASQFGNLRLSALPTQATDDSAAKAIALFGQFLALADYADLRKGPAGATDGLISVFENVGETYTELAASRDANKDPATPWTRLGNLTRRDPQVIRDVALALGLLQEAPAGANRQVTAIGDFGNSRGIRHIWEALQFVQIVGISAQALVASTQVASLAPSAGSPAPDAIATTLKNAVKARYTPEAWRAIAKSVFDKLRQKKRDALIAYLVNALSLENPEQLFEYFLVDPEMEPVVQTSRIRLALSSVQTFIQRCLLNLENGVAGHPERDVLPNAIDADWWTWMKRYRVWEANRKIFLFPENWMEPELRLDKTDLFQVLESALTQGDVTRDLAESTFLDYLKGLEVRARLDVVATYLEQDVTDPGLDTLHVLARTYGHPHKYFYRTYSMQTWSAWEVVTPDIEGDHVTLVVWRGKLNLFWLTFAKKSQAAPAPTGSDSSAVSSLSFTTLTDRIYSASAQEQLQVQLNWSEYFQGQWSERIASDINKTEVIGVQTGFDIRSIHVHVSKETNDAAVKIHLDFPAIYELIYAIGVLVAKFSGGDVSKVPRANHAFRVTSKNCDPAFSGALWEAAPSVPYNTTGVDASVYTGSALLQSDFQSSIRTGGTGTPEQENILQSANNYALVTCANAVVPPFLDPSEPLYQDAGSLVSPFFYKDTSHPSTASELTFFVQPSLTESTILEWEGWAVPVATPDPNFASWIDNVTVIAQVPQSPIPIDPGDPAYSVFPVQQHVDWATNPATAVSYGTAWVGQKGGLSAGVLAASGPGGVKAGTVAGTGVLPGLSAESRPAAGGHVVLVGSGGLSAAHLQSLEVSRAAVASAGAMKTSALAIRQLG
jgi:peptidoglycan hydrolase-like protein with peptidoglycan-binding domain